MQQINHQLFIEVHFLKESWIEINDDSRGRSNINS